MMKLKKFPVSGPQGEVLNWSMGLFLAFSAVNLADHWTSSPNEGQSMFTEAFASIQSSSGIQIAEAVLLLSTKLVMWEILRRNLKKNSHFFLQLSVIILMVLNTILTVATCLPTIHTGAAGSMMIEVGETSRLLSHFVTSCYTIATLVQIGLGIGLFRKFAGMIRCYGASLFLCPLLSSLCSMSYYYIYNNVGGVSMTDIITYGTIATLISFVLTELLPFILLRKSMTTED
ncbi:MAG: hypothetical protein ACFN1B_09745 [Prevotella denticola]